MFCAPQGRSLHNDEKHGLRTKAVNCRKTVPEVKLEDPVILAVRNEYVGVDGLLAGCILL